MIPRYTPPDFAELWSDASKYRTWFDVEIAACEAMEQASLVPVDTAQEIRPVRQRLDAARVEEIEKTTRHDVIAFLTHVEELAGAPARWLHRGMTSSDVLDTALATQLVTASDALLERLSRVLQAFRTRIDEHRTTPMIGRSHGIHAEPVTFGLVLAGHYSELRRAHAHLQRAREAVAVGKIAGAVGTYAHLSLAIETNALAKLGLRPETVATQVVSRDRHATFVMALALVAAAVERFATNVRHWQRTEVAEAEEAFRKGQKGSSAMPHKRNPILTENLCGLARIVRAAVTPALENIALWHERDISHSSVERMILPDVTSVSAFMLDRARSVIESLVAYPDHMQRNLDHTGGLWASEGVLLALVAKGVGRQQAYQWVQQHAMAAFEGRGDFAQLLKTDGTIATHLSSAEIDAQFQLRHALRHIDATIDRALSEELP